MKFGTDPLLFLCYINFVNWFILDCSTGRALLFNQFKTKGAWERDLREINEVAIGLIQPILISLKVLLLETYRLKLAWHDEFREDIKESWEINLREIDKVVNINVDRRFESFSDKDAIISHDLHECEWFWGLYFVDQGKLMLYTNS